MPTPGATGDAIDTYQNVQTLNGWAIQIGVISSDPSPGGGGGGELDPIAIVGYETAAEATSNSITLNVPAGVQKGDMLVAAIRHQTNVSSVDMSNSNFTRVGPDFVPDSNEGRITGFYVHTVLSAGSEPASYTFTKTEGGATRCVGVMILVRPGAGGELSVVGGTTEYTGIPGTDRATNTYDIPDGTDGIELMLGAAEFTSGNDHALVPTPFGFTEIAQATTDGDVGSVSRTTIWTGYRTAPDPAGAGEINFIGTPVSPVAQSIVIGQTKASPPSAYGVKVWDGAEEVDATVWVYDGATEQPAHDVLALPHQSYTISQMEAEIANGDMVYWAHRGGSANFSEMTLRAYTNAIWHGAKVLEFSARRTADGVWIGMHDPDVDRVTSLSGDVDTFNAEDLIGVPVEVPVADGGVIMRLEDFLAAYPDFILMVDNKGSVDMSTFLTICQSVPNYQEHVIIKIDGAAAVGTFQAAKAAGFKTCAYWYDVSNWDAIPDKLPYVDYPGLNWDADQSYWDDMTSLAPGKPIWGHVIQNTTQANTAISKGASMLQCANVLGIIPKYNDLP